MAPHDKHVVVAGTVLYSHDPMDGEPVAIAASGTGCGQPKIPEATSLIELHGTGLPSPYYLWIDLRESPATRSVLVIEDNPGNREYLLAAIERAGYAVRGAGTGTEGIALAQADPPALILIDVRLPDANGFELARLLASTTECEDATIVIISADSRLGDPTVVEAAGAVAFYTSPIAPSDLVTILRRWVPTTDVEDDRPPARSTPEHESFPVAVSVLGSTGVIVGGEFVAAPRGRSCEILAMLAAAAPVSVDAERLVKHVWRNQQSVGINAVYTAVSRLRSFLAKAGAGDIIGSTSAGYSLNIATKSIDAVAFEEAAQVVLRAGEEATAAEIRAALSLWETPVALAASGNDALRRWAHRLSEQRATMVELLVRRLLDDGNPEVAPSWAEDLIDDEPWRESAWAGLAVALYRSGRQSDALATIARAATKLREDLGLDPGPMLSKLELMILTHEPLLSTASWKQLAWASSESGGT